MNISVIGAGYVGLVTGACLAETGHHVICLDANKEKVEVLKSGESPIYEPGLNELLEKTTGSGHLSFTTDYHVACEKAEVIIIAVGTPSRPDGSADLSALKDVAENIGSHARETGTIVVTKSTVPVGTNRKVKFWLDTHSSPAATFRIASNPEFLREGSAIHDTFNGDRIVIGSEEEETAKKLEEMVLPFGVPILHTSIESAEMIKYSSNAFLATKISFINEIANLCEKLGANVEDVAKGMGMDKRIGSSFLQAGIGYGGSCFPKDTNALVQMAGEMEHDFDLLESVIHVNAKQQVKLVQMAKERLKDLKGKRAGLLGLSFKPNTDDIREAASLEMINLLLEEGVQVTVYDPVAQENAKSALGSRVTYADHCFEAIEDQEMLFIATEWEEFKVLRLKTISKLMKNPILFDGRNCFSLEEAECEAIDYYSIGRPPVIHSVLKTPHSE
ncbi:UDP-glucose/GDP-mannose dehydrogenase family protein [Rossellomorea sp. SC111]|uniref:UDP-glucose dehydrogenase family protein n=1 Tax=Rossellomorea sp. SC111 TaxID=2968985 RepID=UPI00215A55D4|nr:UDP-glucose/GDP-mannose dehydrogenase family protein [Rossellomorea sp. SC111]MCR8850376.1 UDP-glucose/GDP-mannose dehydrogenase family protein [Rossellomorea sp. SC111]